jgi:hypothetical protein
MNVRDEWEMRRSTDLAIAAASTVAARYLIEFPPDSATLYQVVGGAAVALVAFVVTPIATLLTIVSGRRAEAFDKEYRHVLIGAMTWAFFAAIGVLLGAILLGAVQPDDASGGRWAWARAALLGGVAGAVSATCRLFVMFVASLRVRLADVDNPLRNLR